MATAPPTKKPPKRFCAVGALWRAANELTGTLDGFALVEAIAKQVVDINVPDRLFANV